MADQCTTIECLQPFVEEANASVSGMESAYDIFWVLLATVLVFFMQAGFAMLEAGTVRRMNVSNILFKNAFDPVLAAIVWWACGWGFAYGIDEDGFNDSPNGFIGNGDFFLTSDGNIMEDYHSFIFQWAFCATAVTIVSGAIAERCYIFAYFIYSLLLCGFVYPVVVHWMWSSEGFLSPFNTKYARLNVGVLDFAGSGVVHMVGGFSALAGAFVVGPRIGWVENQKLLKEASTPEERHALEAKFAPHDKTLMTLGTLILWFGWFGFNCGSTLALSGGAARVAGKVGVTTVLGAAGGGLGALLMTVVFDAEHRLLLDPIFNGILAGLVSVTAGCATIEPYAALLCGAIGGVIYFGSSGLVARLEIDDVLEASAVHGFCGFWGLVATGLFATKQNVKAAYGDSTVMDDMTGAFYGGNGKQLGTQLLGGLLIAVWSFALSFLIFFVLKSTGNLRVPEWTELYGLDNTEHGASAFSKSFQWGKVHEDRVSTTESVKSPESK
eukprot:TRINITY_DN2473_c0_g1_i1.p1 TRINITY_DN2473_c0_g1~~TRINITY_DN2473_c0_g1_i1.p1  ORF type:complete len:497 (+),score=100.94 TRINITY_DN2473_c0_g1_i1:48-1538(+)